MLSCHLEVEITTKVINELDKEKKLNLLYKIKYNIFKLIIVMLFVYRGILFGECWTKPPPHNIIIYLISETNS